MGLFGQIKAAVGVGAAELQLELETGHAYWGSTLRGKLTVLGGQVEQVADKITVNITESWTEQRRNHNGDLRSERVSRSYSERLLAHGVTLAVGSSQSYDFELLVPVEGMLSHDWSVCARVSVPKAADRHSNASFQLFPYPAVMGLVNAICSVAPGELRSMSSQSTQVTVDLKPAPELAKQLDGIKIIVHCGGDQVTGTLEINPQEKSFADRLKALAKQDIVRHQIAFPAASLEAANENAKSTPPEVVDHLRSLIAPHLS